MDISREEAGLEGAGTGWVYSIHRAMGCRRVLKRDGCEVGVARQTQGIWPILEYIPAESRRLHAWRCSVVLASSIFLLLMMTAAASTHLSLDADAQKSLTRSHRPLVFVFIFCSGHAGRRCRAKISPDQPVSGSGSLGHPEQLEVSGQTLRVQYLDSYRMRTHLARPGGRKRTDVTHERITAINEIGDMTR
nr:hypothetical protein CFP56_31756 [Quercus suber]